MNSELPVDGWRFRLPDARCCQSASKTQRLGMYAAVLSDVVERAARWQFSTEDSDGLRLVRQWEPERFFAGVLRRGFVGDAVEGRTSTRRGGLSRPWSIRGREVQEQFKGSR